MIVNSIKKNSKGNHFCTGKLLKTVISHCICKIKLRKSQNYRPPSNCPSQRITISSKTVSRNFIPLCIYKE